MNNVLGRLHYCLCFSNEFLVKLFLQPIQSNSPFSTIVDSLNDSADGYTDKCISTVGCKEFGIVLCLRSTFKGSSIVGK